MADTQNTIEQENKRKFDAVRASEREKQKFANQNLSDEPSYASRIPAPGGGRAPGEIAQAKPLTQEEQERFGNRNKGETEAEEDERFRNMGERQKLQGSEAVQTATTAGQIGGRGVQVASKGVEMVAQGTEALSKGVKKGGQAMTRAGAELSSTGLGAVAGVPMMAAGGLITAGGAVGETASKGVKKTAQTSGRLGKQVADTSKEIKKESKGLQGLPKPDASEPSTGMPYMDLARKLREEKRKIMQGDIAGVVGDGIDIVSQLATARLLMWAWITLIPTFGLTLIYLNIHLIARATAFKEKFCQFGTEWTITKAGGAKTTQSKLAEATDLLGRVEIGAVIALDILVAGLVVFSYLSIALIQCIASNPLEVFDLSKCW